MADHWQSLKESQTQTPRTPAGTPSGIPRVTRSLSFVLRPVGTEVSAVVRAEKARTDSGCMFLASEVLCWAVLEFREFS